MDNIQKQIFIRFNTQPPEGGCQIANLPIDCRFVSTHSRPKAAAKIIKLIKICTDGFNTQPPEGGCHGSTTDDNHHLMFQHTAARRRLLSVEGTTFPNYHGFNTQPPEGGCLMVTGRVALPTMSFNTQPPEGGCI